MSVYSCTRLGGAHDRNQDRALVGSDIMEATDGVAHAALDAPALLGVFDGLGGHPAGDVASELAARLVAQSPIPRNEDELSAVLRAANEAIQDEMRADPARFGMGTTAAVLVLHDGSSSALVANVGDSTVLRLRGDDLEELSVSDRWYGSGVLQCLGANDDLVEPHVRGTSVDPGDRLLISTDGLTDVVPADVLRSTLAGDPDRATTSLLEMVERAGVPDDLTFVLAEIAG